MIPRLAVIGTYPPTQCGIATFSHSLVASLQGLGVDVGVVRLMDEPGRRTDAAVVHHHVGGRGVAATGDVLNRFDVVVVQHEFGIFHGTDGDEVLRLVDRIVVPVIVVLHTVLTNPSDNQRFVMQGLIDKADRLVTMTETGRTNLIEHYAVDEGVVCVIPHGSADLRSSETNLRSDGSSTILTWGLLSEGKGIEWGIEALALLSDLEPRPRYVVAGQTHPKVRAREGERYRESLVARAEANGVSDRVEFVDEYLDADRLAALIHAADVVLLPYDSRDQVTSGVLVEAMVAERPIVSTRFPHAIELLSDGSGELVDQCDPAGIATAVRSILTDRAHAQHLLDLAERKAAAFLWPNVAREYLVLAGQLDDEAARGTSRTTQRAAS